MKKSDLWAKARCMLLAGAVCAGFAACSDDHNDDPRPDGLEEIVAHIESVVNSHLGELYGNATLDELLLPVENDAEAQKVVKEFIREEWNGQDYTYRVPGYCGRIRIRKDSQEGLYYTLAFNINDHMPFTFRLCTPGYPESENAPQGLQHVSGSWQLGSASETGLTTDITEWTDGGSFDGDATMPEPAKVGDYYYSDGTYSTTLDASKTCIGIVFHVGQHENDGSDYSNTGIGKEKCHGYVVALTDATDSYCIWGVYGKELGCCPTDADRNKQDNHNHPDIDWCGYKWTQKIITAAGGKDMLNATEKTGYPATWYAVVSYETGCNAPSNSSGWFLPSIGQLWKIYKHRYTLFDSMSVATGLKSDWYWSSSESYFDSAYCASFLRVDYGTVFYYDKSIKRSYVRPVLAF